MKYNNYQTVNTLTNLRTTLFHNWRPTIKNKIAHTLNSNPKRSECRLFVVHRCRVYAIIFFFITLLLCTVCRPRVIVYSELRSSGQSKKLFEFVVRRRVERSTKKSTLIVRVFDVLITCWEHTMTYNRFGFRKRLINQSDGAFFCHTLFQQIDIFYSGSRQTPVLKTEYSYGYKYKKFDRSIRLHFDIIRPEDETKHNGL